MGCQYLDELYELFAIGALDGEKSAEIQDHLERDCPYCLAHFRESVQTVYLLISLAHPVRPRPRGKTQLLRRLSRTR